MNGEYMHDDYLHEDSLERLNKEQLEKRTVTYCEDLIRYTHRGLKKDSQTSFYAPINRRIAFECAKTNLMKEDVNLTMQTNIRGSSMDFYEAKRSQKM